MNDEPEERCQAKIIMSKSSVNVVCWSSYIPTLFATKINMDLIHVHMCTYDGNMIDL